MAIQFALLAGAAALQFAGQASQASMQGRYASALQIQRNQNYLRMVQYQRELAAWQKKRYEYTTEQATKEADLNYGVVIEGIQQKRKQTANSIQAYENKARQDVGRLVSSNRLSETTGQSVWLAKQASLADSARAANILHDNLEGTIRQGNRNLKSIHARAQNMINAAMPAPMAPIMPGNPVAPVFQPGAAQLFGGIMGAAAGAWNPKTGGFD